MLKPGQFQGIWKQLITLLHGQLHLNHSGDLQRGCVQCNLELFERQGSGEFTQQPSVTAGNPKALLSSYSPSDLCRQGQGVLLWPSGRKTVEDAGMSKESLQAKSGVSQGCVGAAPTPSDTWLFPSSLTGKKVISLLFSFGFPISGEFRPNFISVALSETQGF